jgi:lambda family phage portal protein
MTATDQQKQLAATRTVVDRVVGWISPDRGLARLKSRAMLSAATGGYEGGRRDRRGTKRWRPAQGSADADTLPDLGELRARTRDLERNVPLAAGAIATKGTNVVGTGLTLQACLDHDYLGMTEEAADAWERNAEREWQLACRSIDFTSVQDFADLQYLAFRSADQSGDLFAVRRYRKDAGDVYGTKLQLVEADRVSNPGGLGDSAALVAGANTIAGGVEVNADGVPVAYHVTNRHPGGISPKALTWARVPARSPDGRRLVIHLFERTRPDLTRGVPYLAPVIELIKQLGDFTDAEVRAAVLTSYITWFIQTELPDDPSAKTAPVIGQEDSTLAADEIKLGSGAVVDLAPGEIANAPAPVRPNPQFDPFFLAVTRQIGVALEIPQELLIKHFTASYSASRAALEMAWQSFRRWRSWFARSFCQTSYEWIIEEAVASGRLVAPGFFADPLVRQAYCGANWIGPNRASIDPKKEAEADSIDIGLGVKTREQVCLERTGGKVEDKTRQLGKEQKLRDEQGLTPPAPPAPGQAPSGNADAADAAGDNGDAENETKQGNAAAAAAAFQPIVNVHADIHMPLDDRVEVTTVTRKDADGRIAELERRKVRGRA